MKYYINVTTKQVFAYAQDGSQDKYIKPGLVSYNRTTKGDGSFYAIYLDTPDGEGIYQPDLPACLVLDKESCETVMRSEKDAFCCAGALVTVTVETIDYTGIFKPLDCGLESASGVSVARETDTSYPAVPMGSDWHPRGVDGKRISVPMTEARMSRIMVYVKNWFTACNKAYVDLEMAMWEMEDLTGFDPVADMQAALPSRSITVV